MIAGRKIVVVLPAYNAEKTLDMTLAEFPEGLVDQVILVDDCSSDRTVARAKELGLTVVVHPRNQGYGGNQKTCYAHALLAGADVVVMIHPDYQYTPRILRALCAMVAEGGYEICLGSRILGRGARRGGMPLWRYISNRFLTLVQNVLIGEKLSEYHTGYRAYSRRFLLSIPFESNSDDFVFDNQVLVQARYYGFDIAEVTTPTRYHAEASSINFLRSVVYGLGVLQQSMRYVFARFGFGRKPMFSLDVDAVARGEPDFLKAREAEVTRLARRFEAPAVAPAATAGR